MKRKFAISFIIFINLYMFPLHGSAEEGDPAVKPNAYHEKKIDLKTDYFQEDSSLRKKHALPEEQKALTFEKKPDEQVSEIKSELFKKEQKDNSSIQAKVKQLKLFEKDAAEIDTASEQDEQTDSEQSFSFSLTLLLGIILVLSVIILFFILVPRMMADSQEGRKVKK
ncbi:type VII secretion protein EssA [Bacillus sp. OV322]|uniref:type VII secretion protein EssA n=1 Tax=Bacillus sp. OV322 TaxID=1882764 RepID=UPI0008F18665|nr:type VII secretion protein EssA [Bacillus sp. OV322]SFD00321.1 type VII secretion protein EssA [Bacillus sp. OV322]